MPGVPHSLKEQARSSRTHFAGALPCAITSRRCALSGALGAPQGCRGGVSASATLCVEPARLWLGVQAALRTSRAWLGAARARRPCASGLPCMLGAPGSAVSQRFTRQQEQEHAARGVAGGLRSAVSEGRRAGRGGRGACHRRLGAGCVAPLAARGAREGGRGGPRAAACALGRDRARRAGPAGRRAGGTAVRPARPLAGACRRRAARAGRCAAGGLHRRAAGRARWRAL